MLDKKKAIVTGGAGFIGSHMVDLLVENGFFVTVIDNLSGGRESNLSQHKDNKNVEFIETDICKIKYNDKNFSDTDFVFHFAGKGDIVPSIENPDEYMNTNVNGTLQVLQASKEAKIKKFVYAASSSCYGLAETPTKEDNAIETKYPYALSKYLGEQAALNWNKVYGLPVNSLRIFIVKLFFVKSFVAKLLTVTANVCIPALPPIDATIGIKKANTTICSIVAPNRLMQ